MAKSQSRQEQEDALRESYLSGDHLSGVSEVMGGLRTSVRNFEQDNPPPVRVARTAYAGDPSIRRAIAVTAAPALEQANALRNVELDYGPRSVPGQVRSAEEYEARVNPSPAPVPSTPQRSPFLGGGSRWSGASQDELRSALGAALGEATGLPGPVDINRINAHQAATAAGDRAPRTIGADLYRQQWEPTGRRIGGGEATPQTPGVEWSAQSELRPIRASTPASRNAGVEGTLSGDRGLLRGARRVADTLGRMERVASPEYQEYAKETYGREVTADDLGVYIESPDIQIRNQDIRRIERMMRTGSDDLRRSIIDRHEMSGGEGLLEASDTYRRAATRHNVLASPSSKKALRNLEQAIRTGTSTKSVIDRERIGATDVGVRKVKSGNAVTREVDESGRERIVTTIQPGEVSSATIRGLVGPERTEDIAALEALQKGTQHTWSQIMAHSKVGAGGGGKQYDQFGNPVPVRDALPETTDERKRIQENRRKAQAAGVTPAPAPRKTKPDKPISVLRGGGAGTVEAVNVERSRMTAPERLPNPNAPAIVKGETKVYRVEPTVTRKTDGRQTTASINTEVAAGLSADRLDKLLSAMFPTNTVAPTDTSNLDEHRLDRIQSITFAAPPSESVKRSRGQVRTSVNRKKSRTVMRAEEWEAERDPEAYAAKKARETAARNRTMAQSHNDRRRALLESHSRTLHNRAQAVRKKAPPEEIQRLDNEISKIKELIVKNTGDIRGLGGEPELMFWEKGYKDKKDEEGTTLF